MRINENQKTIILACCVIIASLGISLTGCSNNSSDMNTENSDAKDTESLYVGTWLPKFTEYESVEYDPAEMNLVCELALNADGTGTFNPGDGAGDIKWELTEDGLKITDSVGDYYFTYKDGRLLWECQSIRDSQPYTLKRINNRKTARDSKMNLKLFFAVHIKMLRWQIQFSRERVDKLLHIWYHMDRGSVY